MTTSTLAMPSTTCEAARGPYPMGLMGLLATVVMLFAAFTATLLVRRNATDWIPIELPFVVWPNTVVVILSSVVIEYGRRRARAGEPSSHWIGLAAFLGLVFLAGQVTAWAGLVARGVFLPTSPHASFFYVLTAAHGLHVLGGVIALLWLAWEAVRRTGDAFAAERLLHVAIYWHVVGAVWLHLLLVLALL